MSHPRGGRHFGCHQRAAGSNFQPAATLLPTLRVAMGSSLRALLSGVLLLGLMHTAAAQTAYQTVLSGKVPFWRAWEACLQYAVCNGQSRSKTWRQAVCSTRMRSTVAQYAHLCRGGAYRKPRTARFRCCFLRYIRCLQRLCCVRPSLRADKRPELILQPELHNLGTSHARVTARRLHDHGPDHRVRIAPS
jgi:hypothetical protein